jgi:hypothetical protein
MPNLVFQFEGYSENTFSGGKLRRVFPAACETAFMKTAKRLLHRCLCLWLAATVGTNAGCHCIHHPCDPPSPNVCVQPTAPRELTKVILPPYRIEPPDVLQIDAIRVVPKFPYHLRGLDSLAVQVGGTLPDAPLAGNFVIDPAVWLGAGGWNDGG